jgi:hypothetical protein
VTPRGEDRSSGRVGGLLTGRSVGAKIPDVVDHAINVASAMRQDNTSTFRDRAHGAKGEPIAPVGIRLARSPMHTRPDDEDEDDRSDHRPQQEAGRDEDEQPNGRRPPHHWVIAGRSVTRTVTPWQQGEAFPHFSYRCGNHRAVDRWRQSPPGSPRSAGSSLPLDQGGPGLCTIWPSIGPITWT